MPLLIPPDLSKVTDLQTLIGKKIVDEKNPPHEKDKDYPMDNVVFKSQLPDNILLLNESVDKVAITGAFNSGLVPIIISADGIVKRTF